MVTSALNGAFIDMVHDEVLKLINGSIKPDFVYTIITTIHTPGPSPLVFHTFDFGFGFRCVPAQPILILILSESGLTECGGLLGQANRLCEVEQSGVNDRCFHARDFYFD